jgi:hypothetical protein
MPTPQRTWREPPRLLHGALLRAAVKPEVCSRTPDAEDIEAHFAEVSATEPFIVPSSIFDEVADTCAQLGIPI